MRANNNSEILDDTEGIVGKKGLRHRFRKQSLIPAKFKPRFFEDSDGRIAVIRLIKKRVDLLREHCGGHESAQRDLLCQRLAFISVVLETQEVRCCEKGDLENLGAYVQALNSMVGLIRLLGLERHIKKAGGLHQYLEQRRSGH